MQLRNRDPRCEVLEKAVLDVLYERGTGLTVATVLGVLRLVEHRIIEDAESLP